MGSSLNSSKKNPAKHLLERDLWTTIATIGPVGFAPRAPGTWGSVVGLAFGYLVHRLVTLVAQPVSATFAIIVATVFVPVIILSLVAIQRTEQKWHLHDASCIVVDEVVAQALVVLWWPATFASYLLGFALFRLFDIWKPWPVNVIDRKWPGAYGTFFDDIAATAYAVIPLALAHHLIDFEKLF